MKEKLSKTSPSKKRSLGWRIAKFLGFFLLIISLFLIITLAVLDYHLQSNKAKIFDQLAFLNHGCISFEEAEISIYKNFPATTISLHNLMVKDSLFPKHQIPFLQVGELRTALSLEKLWEDEVELKSIELYNGQINFHRDSSGYKLLDSLLPKRSDTTKSSKNNPLKGFQFRTDKIDVSLFNVYINFTDIIKKTSIQGNAEQLLAQLHIDETGISADVDMQIDLKEMAFNIDQGAYLKNSKLIGKPHIHIYKNILTFDPFEIQINQELFTFNAVYDIKKKVESNFYLENKSTRWEKIAPLLSNNVQKAITPYYIQKPFYTKTLIKLPAIKGEKVVVDIDFEIAKNEIKVFNFDLNHTNLKGRFVNRIFDSEKDTKGKKGITLVVNNLSTTVQNFQLNTQNALITAFPKKTPQLLANVQVNGNAKDISKMLSSNQFLFHDGSFDLSAQVNGPINNFNQLLLNSNASLELDDIDVYYKPADITFPFKQLLLSKKAGDANFELISSTRDSIPNFQIIGLLKNLPPLLVELKDQRAQSEARFDAKKLDWVEFINWFEKKGDQKDESANAKTEGLQKKSMKQTIRGINNKFQPHLSLNIDTLSYYGLLQIDNFLTSIYFEDDNYLVLEKTSFNYEKGDVKFKARLDISDSLQTPFDFELQTNNLNLEKLLPPLDYFNIKLLANLEKLPAHLNLTIKHRGIIDDKTGLMPNTSTGEINFDIKGGEVLSGEITYEPDLKVSKDSIRNNAFTQAKILLEGDPFVFNTFLKTENFFFSKGRFYFEFNYNDNQTSLIEVLNGNNTTLQLLNSSVHYKPTGVDFPLTKIDLSLNSDIADFDFFVRSDSLQREIRLIGVIENLSELVIGNTGKSIKSTVDVTSPKLIWNHFVGLFIPESKNSNPVKERNLDTLSATISGIFKTFGPSLKAHVDTLVISNKFTVNDFHSGIHMADSNNLILEETTFNFYDGSMSVNGQLDLNTIGPLPFKANFSSKDLDVEKFLISLDYLSLPSLEKIEKLSGRLAMNFDLSGLVNEDGKSLIPEATKGVLDIRLDDVVLRGMATLDSLAHKLRMKKRFAEVRFAPIENRFIINGKDIQIPILEIQSNAINLFIDGTLSYSDKTNLWIAIPLDNFKKTDRSIVPKKRSFAAVKSMVYVEVTSNEAGDNKYKFRLSRKKYYKKRGIPSRYRADKKEFKRKRKEFKKLNRK
jgi:hypothetical protein